MSAASAEPQFNPAMQLPGPSPFQPIDLDRRGAGTVVGGALGKAGGSKAPRTATQVLLCSRGAFDQDGINPRHHTQMIMVDGDGNQVDNTGGFIINRLDCQGSDGLYHTLTVQEVEDCDPMTGTKYYRLVLVSDRYSPH
jgi:hypothetical protein